jgi:hypothetical protein
MRTDPLSQLLGRKQTVGFNDGPLPMHPLWLDGIEPGAFRRESEGQDAHPFSGQFDLLVVFSDPGLHDLADMPGSIIPDQQPGFFAARLQALAAVIEKLGCDVTHWTPRDKTQPHFLPPGIVCWAVLPQYPIASQGFGVGIAFFLRLLVQAHRMLFALPGMHAREGKATPPDLILKADHPVGLLARPSDQLVTSIFFCRYNVTSPVRSGYPDVPGGYDSALLDI